MSKYSRQKVVDLAESWIGKKESDGSYKQIIDIYNTQKTFPRGAKMQYGWAWCACTWSALAVKLGYTNIMPVEISCHYLVEKAKEMGCWVESDSYIPKAGDAIVYDWNDNGVGENKSSPDHVGTIVYVNKASGYMTVVEGNYSKAVKKRTISLNGKFIRGFITPKYDKDVVVKPTQQANKSLETVAREVITGQWGNSPKREKNLRAKGYDPVAVQKKVNEILKADVVRPTTNTTQNTTSKKAVVATCKARKFSKNVVGTYKTAKMYMRNDAGDNKKALVILPKNTEVRCYGYFNVHEKVKWLYVKCTVDGVSYTGYCHSKYLTKV